MKLAGFEGVCKAENHYDCYYKSPWAPDLAYEKRHKQLMMVKQSKQLHCQLTLTLINGFAGILQVV